jgi:hypothetical protein
MKTKEIAKEMLKSSSKKESAIDKYYDEIEIDCPSPFWLCFGASIVAILVLISLYLAYQWIG